MSPVENKPSANKTPAKEKTTHSFSKGPTTIERILYGFHRKSALKKIEKAREEFRY